MTPITIKSQAELDALVEEGGVYDIVLDGIDGVAINRACTVRLRSDGSLAQARSAGSLAQARAEGSRAQALAADSCAQACVAGSCAQAWVAGSRAQACMAGSLAQACVAGSLSEARAKGSLAEAWAKGSRAEAWAKGSRAQARAKGSRAQACVAGSRAEAWAKGSIAEACVAGSRAEACVAGSRAVDLWAGAIVPLDMIPADIPIVADIDRAIAAAIGENSKCLEMATWHMCETTHCRGGWAITLAGEAGEKCERKYGAHCAAAFIYAKSRPGVPLPDFYANNEAAMADILACASK